MQTVVSRPVGHHVGRICAHRLACERRAGQRTIALLYALLFLFLPSASIFIRSFQAPDGSFTLQNFVTLFGRSDIINAYKTSLSISVITSFGGAIFGFLLAYAVVLGGLPAPIRTFR